MNKRWRAIQPRYVCWLSAVIMLACAAAGVADQKKNGAAAGVFTEDRGKFTIKLDGQAVGHEEFAIEPSGGGWLAKGNSDLKTQQGPESKVTGALTLDPAGVPISYEWTSQADKTNVAHVLFTNGMAKMTLEMQGAHPFDQTFTFNSSLIAVLDNNLYHQYAVLARIYDWSKRGAQTFPVFIPQELMPGTITAEATGSASANGKSYEGLRVNTTDLEIDLLLDASHRLMRLEVPAAKVSVTRD